MVTISFYTCHLAFKKLVLLQKFFLVILFKVPSGITIWFHKYCELHWLFNLMVWTAIVRTSDYLHSFKLNTIYHELTKNKVGDVMTHQLFHLICGRKTDGVGTPTLYDICLKLHWRERDFFRRRGNCRNLFILRGSTINKLEDPWTKCSRLKEHKIEKQSSLSRIKGNFSISHQLLESSSYNE